MTFWVRKTDDGAARMEQRHRRPEKGMAGATWQETQIYAKPRPVHRAPRAVQ